MRRVKFTPQATRDLELILAYISRDNSAAAAQVVERILSFSDLIGDFPGIGRVLSDRRAWSTIVPGLPYRVVYRIGIDQIEVVAVRHARRRPLAP